MFRYLFGKPSIFSEAKGNPFKPQFRPAGNEVNSIMKEFFLQLAIYNTWANQRLIDCIMALPEEDIVKELPGSFPSLQQTLLHLWDAENIWWQRLKLQEGIRPPSASFKGNSRDIVTALLHQNKLWEAWVTNASPAALEHVFLYYDFNRQPVKLQVRQLLLHLFNHGTYHRGQLVTQLRQLGVQKIPQTDFLVWARLKK